MKYKNIQNDLNKMKHEYWIVVLLPISACSAPAVRFTITEVHRKSQTATHLTGSLNVAMIPRAHGSEWVIFQYIFSDFPPEPHRFS